MGTTPSHCCKGDDCTEGLPCLADDLCSSVPRVRCQILQVVCERRVSNSCVGDICDCGDSEGGDGLLPVCVEILPTNAPEKARSTRPGSLVPLKGHPMAEEMAGTCVWGPGDAEVLVFQDIKAPLFLLRACCWRRKPGSDPVLETFGNVLFTVTANEALELPLTTNGLSVGSVALRIIVDGIGGCPCATSYEMPSQRPLREMSYPMPNQRLENQAVEELPWSYQAASADSPPRSLGRAATAARAGRKSPSRGNKPSTEPRNLAQELAKS